MKAGYELDALIAEKVMGWTPRDRPFSTSIAAAWEVVERLHQRGHSVRIYSSAITPNDRFEIRIEMPQGLPIYESASTAPLAICLAALKAIGHKFD